MLAMIRTLLGTLSRRGRVAVALSLVGLVSLVTTAVYVVVDGPSQPLRDGEPAAEAQESTSTAVTAGGASTSSTAASSAPTTSTSLPPDSPVPSTSTAPQPRDGAPPAATSSPTPAVTEPPPATQPPPAPPRPGPAGAILEVPTQYPNLQAALDVAAPGSTIRLAVAGEHAGPAVSRRDGAPGAPIVITAVSGARLTCPGGQHRCLELNHSWYRLEGLTIEGGTSNLYMVGAAPGSYVHDVKVLNSTFRGRNGTGECIRVKYHAHNIEIAHNDIGDCGLGKCCASSKNGEGVYVGTAPEQLADKNPSPEPDATHDVWIHHNVMHPRNECVDIKESSYAVLVENNTCGGQSDPESGAFGSRGGRVGAGNIFRFNTIENALGACIRFGGDADPEGTGNEFRGNVCRDIAGEYGVKQMRSPQGAVCENRFEGVLPSERLSRDEAVDPTAPC